MSRAPHRSFPKPVRRLTAKVDQRRLNERAWAACCRTVETRDGRRCRVCGRRVVKTLAIVPERLEHHHLEARSIVPSLWAEPRNVIVVCLFDHGRLTRHEIEPTGTTRFQTAAGSFLNADSDIRFL